MFGVIPRTLYIERGGCGNAVTVAEEKELQIPRFARDDNR